MQDPKIKTVYNCFPIRKLGVIISVKPVLLTYEETSEVHFVLNLVTGKVTSDDKSFIQNTHERGSLDSETLNI